MFQVVVVGAGPSGLCAAKTILQHDPETDLVIVDANQTPGGVWAKERLYPTLRTNNLVGQLDFSDFPMRPDRFNIAEGQHVTGDVMHAYLAAYADHFDLTGRIRFGTRVEEVVRRQEGEKTEAGWSVAVVDCQGRRDVLDCAKLVVCVGVNTVPHMPNLEGAQAFGRPILHASALGPNSSGLFAAQSAVRSVAVLGGSKSAYDAVYLAASEGRSVEWIIRKSGAGPHFVFPTHTYLGPFRAFREKLVTRRLFSLLSPSSLPDVAGFGVVRALLHGTTVGRALVRGFWGLIHADTVRDCGYRTHSRTAVLEPKYNPFWYGTASGTLNYPTDIFEYVRSGRVTVHREDVARLSAGTIHLADGTDLRVDALIAATGFSAKPAVAFQPASLHSDLGIPSTELSEGQKAFWARLDANEDASLAAQFPWLVAGPDPVTTDTKTQIHNLKATRTSKTALSDGRDCYSPWRLYRGIAPPGLAAAGDRSLVFLGVISNTAATVRLEVQCLWALAYLTGVVGSGALPGLDADVSAGRVFRDAAALQRFSTARAPFGHGADFPDLVFDQLPYWDWLLHDLGLATRRKGGWVRELLEPYGRADYGCLIEEWEATQGGGLASWA